MGKVILLKIQKYYIMIERLSQRYTSKNYQWYRFKDAIRAVFFNPLWGNSIKSNLLIQINNLKI